MRTLRLLTTKNNSWFGSLVVIGCILAASLAACTPQKQPPADHSEEAQLEISEFQQSLIDGGVTDTEYQTAVDAMVNCMEAQGMRASLNRSANGLTQDFSWSPVPDGPFDVRNLDEAQHKALARKQARVYWSCNTEFLRDVQYEYLKAHTLTGAARDAEMNALITCLETAAGVTGVNLEDNREQVQAKIDAQVMLGRPEQILAGMCMQRHELVFPPIRDQSGPPPE